MARGKNINLFLMDGDVNGRMKCSIANWTGLVFKIPRTALDACKNRPELKQTGVYFLFGKDEETDNNVIYVGQAGVRKNGEGILTRLLEHNRNPKKDYWTEAVAVTTSDDSLGPTEISYLEHRFCELALQAKRYDVMNGNDPSPGNPSEEKQCELEEFIDFAKIIVGVLGHKAFVPLTSKPLVAPAAEEKESAASVVTPESEATVSESQTLYCKRGGANAVGVMTSDGFVVKKGSVIDSVINPGCPEHVIKKRNQLKNMVDENWILIDDVLFNSASGASSYVCGSSTNGNVVWKNADGVALKDLGE